MCLCGVFAFKFASFTNVFVLSVGSGIRGRDDASVLFIVSFLTRLTRDGFASFSVKKLLPPPPNSRFN